MNFSSPAPKPEKQFLHSKVNIKLHHFVVLSVLFALCATIVLYSIHHADQSKSMQRHFAKNDAEKLLKLLPVSIANQIQQPAHLNSIYHVSNNIDDVLTITNPSIDFKVSFFDDGINFQQSDKTLHFSMALTAYGYENAMQLVQSVRPLYRDNRVYYRRDQNLLEWYANTATGLEQLFTIMAPPPQTAEQSNLLTLQIAIAGNVESNIIGGVLALSHPAGDTTFYYKNLQVFDRDGKTLPATMALNKNTLSIEVNTSNAAFPITVDPLFSKEYPLISGDTVKDEQYGETLAIDGDTAVVGAFIADPGGVLNEGSVYIFTRQADASWTLKQKLLTQPALASTGSDWFGKSVAISGNTLMVTSLGRNLDNTSKDIVSIYEKNPFGVWEFNHAIEDLPSFSLAGEALALEGNVAVVGTDNGNDIGAAYVYSKVGTKWVRKATLTATTSAVNDRFGTDISIFGDTIVIGAQWVDLVDDFGTIISNAGAVYIYEKNPAVVDWVTTTETHRIVAADATTDDYFGDAVDFDGTTLAVGASRASVLAGGGEGAVYLYTGSAKNWTEQKKFVPVRQTALTSAFGSSIRIRGNDLLVGSRSRYSLSAVPIVGSVFHYKKATVDWVLQKQFFASDASQGASFGAAVELSGDYLLVGAPANNFDPGKAYIFDTAIDLSIVKTDSSVAGFVPPNTVFDYQLTVTNQDPVLPATSVTVTDTLPAALNIVNPTTCTLSVLAANSLTCAMGDLVAGGTSSVSIAVSAPSSGTVINSASVTATQADHVIANNTNTLSTVINNPPSGISQQATLMQGSFVDLVLAGSDLDLDPLIFAIVTQPIGGSLTGTAPNIRYTPASDFSGPDSFSFTVSDGKQTSAPAPVVIDVIATNQPPIASNDIYSVSEGAQLVVAAPGVLANDIDPNDDALTLSLAVLPTNGTVVLNGDGSFTYTHNGSQTSSDSFSYAVADPAGLSSTAIVSITIIAVNNPPVASSEFYTVNEGGNLSIVAPGLLTNAIDPDPGDILSVVGLVPLSGPTNGTAILNSDGSFSYTHNGSETLLDTFNYQIKDVAGLTSIATVDLTITPVNDKPVANNDTYNVNEGASLVVSAPGLLVNDSDPDGDVITISTIPAISPNNGTLTINADGSFSYVHNGSETSNDSFSYTVSDPAGLSATAVVSISINAVNDPPIASSEFYTVNEAGNLSIAAPGLLSNAFDPDPGDILSVVGLVPLSGPTNGTAILNSDGSFSYTHNGNETIRDIFNYQIKDTAGLTSIATVDLTITPVNDKPVAINDTYSVNEGASLVVNAPGLLANDSDPELAALSVSTTIVTPASNGVVTLSVDGSFVYDHDGSETTSDSFAYQVSDGTLTAVATVNITVAAINDAPIANSNNLTLLEDITTSALLSGSDAENSSITYILVTPPSKGSITLDSVTGDYSYIPQSNLNGPDAFTFKVNDGSLDSTAATISVNITAVNDAPTVSNGLLDVIEDLAVEGVLAANDIDADPLQYSILTQPTKGTIVLNGVTGTYTYTPGLNLTGADSFTFLVNDGTIDSNVATVNVNISVLQDTPTASPASFLTDEDVVLSNKQLSAIDPDGDALTYFVDVAPTQGNLDLIPSTGSFTYTPTLNSNGVDYFDYHVSDGLNLSSVVRVNLTITPVNDAPTADNDTLDVSEDTPTTGVLLASDIDLDTLNYEIVSVPAKGNVVMTNSVTGAFEYTPLVNNTGADSFTFKVSDGLLFSNEATVAVSIRNQNDAPVADNQVVEVDEDSTLAITLTASDPDNDSVTFSIATQPTRGVLSGTAPNVIYTPNLDIVGNDSFVFTASDSLGAKHNANISIDILPVNDKPIALNGTLLTQQERSSASQLSASDIDGDTLNYTVVTPPARGILTLGENGLFEYVPNTGEFGKDQFFYKVSDGSIESDLAVITVYINATGNVAPSKPELITPTLNESDVDSAPSVTFIWNKATDADGDDLVYQIQYCDSVLLEKCEPVEVNPQLSLYFNIGGSTAGILLFGLVGTNRRRKLRQMLCLVGVILFLNACNDAAEEGSRPIELPDTQMSFTATDLIPATEYYWKITVEDGRGGVTKSDASSFTTL